MFHVETKTAHLSLSHTPKTLSNQAPFGGTMRYFEIEMDENGIRSFIKTIVDHYEKGLHDHGNYDIALEYVQEATLNNMENVAESIEELIEHTGTMH